jgi:hypothetical protein
LDSTVIRPAPVRRRESNDDLIGHCRELLGEDGVAMSDDEIDALRRSAEAMARVLIGVFLARSAEADRP